MPFILLLILLCSAHSKDPQNILEIRKTVEKINRVNSGILKSEKTVQAIAGGEESVTIFNQGGKVVKISTYYLIYEMAQVYNDYYYQDGKLIFAFEKFQKVGVEDDDIKSYEERYYFENDKLIRYLNSTRNTLLSEFKDVELKILNSSNNYLYLSGQNEKCPIWNRDLSGKFSCKMLDKVKKN